MSGNPFVRPQYHCAGPKCEQIKKSGNHWFVIWEHDGAFTVFPLALRTYPDAMLPTDQPVCGQACAQKLFEAWMARAATNPTTKEIEASVPAADGAAT